MELPNPTEAQSLAHRIILGVVRDLYDRRGTREGWDAIDEDLRASMIRRWEAIAAKEITAEGEIKALYRELGDPIA